MTADPWARLAGRFVDHYDSLYGQVRTRVLHEHLRPTRRLLRRRSSTSAAARGTKRSLSRARDTT